MTELEPRLFGAKGNLLVIGDLPTIETYCDWDGKPGEYKESQINWLSYSLLPSEQIPFFEIQEISRENLKSHLTDLPKKYPDLLKNKSLKLVYNLGTSNSVELGILAGEIKYIEVENK
jgi:hypothetical protein